MDTILWMNAKSRGRSSSPTRKWRPWAARLTPPPSPPARRLRGKRMGRKKKRPLPRQNGCLGGLARVSAGCSATINDLHQAHWDQTTPSSTSDQSVKGGKRFFLESQPESGHKYCRKKFKGEGLKRYLEGLSPGGGGKPMIQV
jgi:hypothetical protein